MAYKDRMDSGYMGMISEDRSAPANLPQEKKTSYYKKCPYLGGDLDDSIVEIDKNADKNAKKLKEHASNTMY